MDHSGRSFESERPLERAAEPCSRIPRWIWRPARLSGSKFSAPSRPTEVEPVRSAEPASSHGTRSAIAFSTLFEALRVAIPFSSALEAGEIGVPALRQLPALHRLELARQIRLLHGVPRQQLFPGRAQLRASPADPLGEVLGDAIGDQELRVLGPAVGPLRLAHLLLAEWLAVGLGGVDLVRRAIADVAIDDDQRWTSVLHLEFVKSPGEQLEVVGVAYPGDVPPVAHEAGGDVVRIGDLGTPVDRDVVVVVDPAEVVEPLVPGERGGLAGDTLHEVAVAGEGVDVEVEELEAGVVEARRQPLRGDRHPDAGRDPLAERAGGGLDPGGQPVLGMPRALRAELAEALDVVETDRGLADHLVIRVDRPDPGQIEERVEQHRGVTVGEDEAVAVRPDRVLGIEAQEPLPEDVGDRRQRHRRPGMARSSPSGSRRSRGSGSC